MCYDLARRMEGELPGVIKIGLGELLVVVVVLFGMGLLFLLIRGKTREDE